MGEGMLVIEFASESECNSLMVELENSETPITSMVYKVLERNRG